MSNQTETIEVLLVEDNPGDVTLIDRYLRDLSGGALARPVVTHVESVSAAAERLATASFDSGSPRSSNTTSNDEIGRASCRERV